MILKLNTKKRIKELTAVVSIIITMIEFQNY